MKMKLLIIVCLIGILTGCSESASSSDNVNRNQAAASPNNRFIMTEDSYYIDDRFYNVVYDNITKIVYLFHKGGYSNTDTQILYGSDKLPMTIDEYNKTK